MTAAKHPPTIVFIIDTHHVRFTPLLPEVDSNLYTECFTNKILWDLQPPRTNKLIQMCQRHESY